MRSVLAIHPGALGDVLLAVPALRRLRGDADALTIAAQPRIAALLVALGVADHAIAVESLGLDALFGGTTLAPHALLARHLDDGARIVCWFGARDADFVGRLRALAPDAVIASPATSEEAVWRHLLRTTRDTAKPDADRGLSDVALAACEPIGVSPALLHEGRSALQAIGWDGASPVLVVHPGAGGVAKRWPTEGFAAAVESVAAAIMVHQGPADAEAARAFVDTVRRPVLLLVEPSLPTLAGVLATATAYLGNDSGVSHLAAAVGAPSVVLFTKAARPWTPWSVTARCLTVTMSTLVDDECRAVRVALSAVL